MPFPNDRFQQSPKYHTNTSEILTKRITSARSEVRIR
jgi:hypothetical protein